MQLLIEGVHLYLVDGRHHLVERHEIRQPIRLEVADADCPDLAGLLQLLHRPPGAVDIPVGLMDEIEIHIIKLQTIQGALELRLGSLVAGVLQPELGGDKELAAPDAALPDPVPDLGLILIGGGGIDQPIAGVYGLDDGTLALCRLRHLEDSKAQQGHLYTVIESDCVHDYILPTMCAQHNARGLTRLDPGSC
ncbi:hypothetical protein D3C73_956990 [compost metagenome]